MRCRPDWVRPDSLAAQGYLPWWRRVPTLRRLVLVTGVGLLVWGFGALGHWAQEPAQPFVFRCAGPPGRAGHIAFRGDRMNVLIVGIDYNRDGKGMPYTNGARSDTMMLVSLSSTCKFFNVLSIPRDVYAELSPALGSAKLNSAYSCGGVNQTIETVESFTGVNIDHYVAVKIHGAKKCFNALGGLELAVEKNMDYDDNWGQLHIHLKKGRQTLNGDQALGYARFCMDEEGDRGRMRRQQQTIQALVKKLKDPAVIMKAPELAKAVTEALETDIKIMEMVDPAMLYKDFDPQKVLCGQLVGDDQTVNGVTVIIPYAPENQKTIRRLLKDSFEPR